MKSKLRIDFRGIDAMPSGQQFEPVIRIGVEDSEDVRDGLVKAFFEKLAHKSNWLRADFDSYDMYGKLKTDVTITPISPDELDSTILTMISRIEGVTTEEWCENQLRKIRDEKHLESILDSKN